jgi:WD40 repeat protein
VLDVIIKTTQLSLVKTKSFSDIDSFSLLIGPSWTSFAYRNNNGNEVVVRDLNSGAILFHADSNPVKLITSFVFSSDDKLFAVGTSDGFIQLWDLNSRKLKNTFTVNYGDVTTLTFSPDNELLVSGNEDNSISIIDVATGIILASLRDFSINVATKISFSPDGKTLGAATIDRLITLWNTKTFSQLSVLEGRTDPLNFEFSDDSSLIVVNDIDIKSFGLIRIYDARSGRELNDLQPEEPESNNVCVPCVLNFALNKSVIVLYGLKNLELWNFYTGKRLRTIYNNSEITIPSPIMPRFGSYEVGE